MQAIVLPFHKGQKGQNIFSEEGYVAYYIMQLKCTLCIIVYP